MHWLLLCTITSMDATQLNKSRTNCKKNPMELKELRSGYVTQLLSRLSEFKNKGE